MIRSPAACVKRYLELISRQPRRGTKSGDLVPLRRQLEVVEEHISLQPDAVSRLHLHQQAIDLQTQIALMETEQGDYDQIEEEFIESVAGWAGRKGVTFQALREAGVSARVLRRAGMSP